jgi:hypothetical protein
MDPVNRLQDGKEICRMVHIPPVKEQKVASKGKRTLAQNTKKRSQF